MLRYEARSRVMGASDDPYGPAPTESLENIMLAKSIRQSRFGGLIAVRRVLELILRFAVEHNCPTHMLHTVEKNTFSVVRQVPPRLHNVD